MLAETNKMVAEKVVPIGSKIIGNIICVVVEESSTQCKIIVFLEEIK